MPRSPVCFSGQEDGADTAMATLRRHFQGKPATVQSRVQIHEEPWIRPAKIHGFHGLGSGGQTAIPETAVFRHFRSLALNYINYSIFSEELQVL